MVNYTKSIKCRFTLFNIYFSFFWFNYILLCEIMKSCKKKNFINLFQLDMLLFLTLYILYCPIVCVRCANYVLVYLLFCFLLYIFSLRLTGVVLWLLLNQELCDLSTVFIENCKILDYG